MELRCATGRWCLVAMLVCLHGVSASAVVTQNTIRATIKEVVVEALKEHCPIAEQDVGWRCSCPVGFIPCAGRCYTRLHRAVEYSQAERECNLLGGHLAVPRSREQNLCAAGLARLDRVWLGVTDRDEEGFWVGADGFPLTGNEGHWLPNQPDNAGGLEHCVEIHTASGPDKFAKWNDWLCTGATAFPMCQLR